MFFERIGKLFFTEIRPFVWYAILAAPLIASFVFALTEHWEVSDREEHFAALCKKGRSALHRRAKKVQFLQRHTDANPYFLDEAIESLSFLEGERKEIESLLAHPAVCEKRALEARLRFLKEDNRLSFTEEGIQSNAYVKETQEKQRRSIQLSEDDLKQLLARIEDVAIDSFLPEKNSPQIVVSNFHLRKRQEVLELDMELMKREFLQNEK